MNPLYHRLLESADNFTSKQIDLAFKEKTKVVFEKTNCLDCANCCRNYSPIIDSDEIPILLNATQITPNELFDNYIEMDEDGDFVFKIQPCPFLNLEDNKCSIYEHRPKACREYPHTNMKSIKNHFDLLEKNIDICPAANAVVESILNEWQTKGK